MKVTIDENSGYCFGVEFAIQMAEDELTLSDKLYCLGDIVHNRMEVERLNNLGLVVIDKEQLKDLKDCKVLIRAHGEPPETYQLALKNNLELIDASCPVVLKLQNRVKSEFDSISKKEGQIVIYGQKGHAEVEGLVGQTNKNAIVVTNESDLEQIDCNKPISLFSQTTKSTNGYYQLKKQIEDRMRNTSLGNEVELDFNDSICRQVSNREPQLKVFSSSHDVILFVSGKKSSNGKALYQVCKLENIRSYFIESEEEIELPWFENVDSVGICGATSTPMWLMNKVAAKLNDIYNN
ncbi:MAG: 4-hydroxy-3-methylbut-2-enyl diphosphate reductase [Cytophagales bacterium]|nr:MAG: 4-hydroxy-3-methylbut-2-enyl diphosphate reductase [Cytophagales bacterium]